MSDDEIAAIRKLRESCLAIDWNWVIKSLIEEGGCAGEIAQLEGLVAALEETKEYDA